MAPRITFVQKARIIKQLVTFLLALLLSSGTSAQKIAPDSLEKVIYAYNNAFEYDKSIALLSQMLADPVRSAADRSKFYLFKSYTYKRLFNYGQATYNLDLAIEEARESPEAEKLVADLKAEKAFIYFDTQDYDKASGIMKELEEQQYRHLTPQNVALLLLQASFLRIKEKNYTAAERNLDDAIALARQHSPHDLPLFYGKKIHLYNAIGRYDLRDSAFREGYREAEKTGIIKYQMYLYEVLKGELYVVKDHAAALLAQKKYDSLAYVYDYTGYAGKAQVLDKKMEDEKKLQELARQKKQKTYLLAMVLLLLFLIPVIYFYRKHQPSPEGGEATSAGVFDLSRYDLTTRQREIIVLVQQGKSNKEIADMLYISENTVKYHLKGIYETLAVKRRAQLQRFRTSSAEGG